MAVAPLTPQFRRATDLGNEIVNAESLASRIAISLSRCYIPLRILYNNINQAESFVATVSTWPRLSKAPIVEGLIDIHVERSSNATISALKAVCDELATEFPSRQEMRTLVAQVNVSPDPNASTLTTDETPGGVVLRSIDEKWVVQFRLDGFTVSRLKPYGTWDELKGKASALWLKYLEAANPKKIVRIASRFINRVQLPIGESFEKTFLTNFVIGPSLPQSVAGYLLRVIIPFEELNATAIMTQSLEENSADCILDLDTFSIQPQGIGEQNMWTKLDELREVKNRLFFGCFTDAALERFK
ncbi:MAG: TIGR04255 family protein [Planctomycetes bacterium]|nr:TIGR04255 family protein [Planctomycetota bacterium]